MSSGRDGRVRITLMDYDEGNLVEKEIGGAFAGFRRLLYQPDWGRGCSASKFVTLTIEYVR